MKRALLLLSASAALTAAAAMADVAVVTQVGFTFDPAVVTLSPGDTVRWVYTSGDHTVTSGTGPFDPESGFLFDGPLTAASPLFEHVFDDPGEYPYFCIPHFFFGMTGVVIVEEATSTEGATWSSIKTLFAD